MQPAASAASAASAFSRSCTWDTSWLGWREGDRLNILIVLYLVRSCLKDCWQQLILISSQWYIQKCIGFVFGLPFEHWKWLNILLTSRRSNFNSDTIISQESLLRIGWREDSSHHCLTMAISNARMLDVQNPYSCLRPQLTVLPNPILIGEYLPCARLYASSRNSNDLISGSRRLMTGHPSGWSAMCRSQFHQKFGYLVVLVTQEVKPSNSSWWYWLPNLKHELTVRRTDACRDRLRGTGMGWCLQWHILFNYLISDVL